jgi:hypothetical protein
MVELFTISRSTYNSKSILRNTCIAMAVSSLLAACDSHSPQPPGRMSAVAPAAYNTVILPPVVYGHYQGRQMSKSDDACDVPDSLRQAVQDQLQARYEFVLSALGAGMDTAPSLKIEVMDIVTVSAGGPTIVVIHVLLERPGLPAAQFTDRRQMHTQFSDITAETTECSTMEAVVRELGVDIAKWMLKPVDGVFLVNGE